MASERADDLDTATFRASFPPIMSAIRTGSDGMRIQLDIPEVDMGEAVKLLTMRGKVLRVTIEPIPTDDRPKSTRIYRG